MPKATLTFDLEQPHECREHMAAVQGMDWALLVWELYNQLRRWEKADKEITVECVRAWLCAEMVDRNLSTDSVC